MKQSSLSSIAYKTTVIHTITYFVIGLLSFLLLDYNLKYADPAVAAALRQTDHPMVTAGPLFQLLYCWRYLEASRLWDSCLRRHKILDQRRDS